MLNEGFLVIYIALQVVDIWSTDQVLARGGREVNPVLAKLFTRFPPVPAMIVTKIPAVVLLWWADMFLTTILCCLIYLWVVINNLTVLKNSK